MTTFDRSKFITSNQGQLLDFFEVTNWREHFANVTGTYDNTVRATNKATGAIYACKTYAKKNLKNQWRLWEEIEFMKQMDHPNIINLFQTFDDHKNIYLILDLCTGGELFDTIIQKGWLTEAEAAILVKQILSALFYMHEMHVAHRDLKPENFLFASKEKDSPLKVINFGLGAKYDPEEKMTTKAGTPYYVSPQVLQGSYTEKCDIWSVGVLMFILLAGYPPFYGEKDAEILSKVRKAKFSFPTEYEDGVEFSAPAKDLISKMLTYEEGNRPSAQACLCHEWFSGVDNSDRQVNVKAISNLKNWHGTQKFQKMARTAIATQLGEQEIKHLKETFQLLDKNGDGTLTLDEMKKGCKEYRILLPSYFEEVFTSIDSDGSGKVDYTEFIAATIDESLTYREDLLWGAFRVFDRDGDGAITVDELVGVLHSPEVKDAGWKTAKLIEQFDKNSDGVIDFDEFKAMLMSAGDTGDMNTRTFFKLSKSFKDYDLNGDGTISRKELTDVLSKLDSSFGTKETMDALFASFGKCSGSDDCLDTREFASWIAATPSKEK